MISQHMGAIPFLGAVFDNGPWYTWLKAFLFSIGGMYTVALLLERRILIPSQQYQSFIKGDTFGLPLIMVAIQPMLTQMPPGDHHWYTTTAWHAGMLLLGVAIGVGFKFMEWKTGAYSLEQVFSPISIYHNGIVFPGFIYWIGGFGIPTVLYSRVGIRAVVHGGSEPTVLLLILVAALVYWASLIWRELRMTDEEHAEKRAHVAVSPRVAMLNGPAAFLFALAYALADHRSLEARLLSAAILGGLVYYATTVMFDSSGKATPKPWAHVPFRLRDWNPFARKRWPVYTKGLTPWWAKPVATAA